MIKQICPQFNNNQRHRAFWVMNFETHFKARVLDNVNLSATCRSLNQRPSMLNNQATQSIEHAPNPFINSQSPALQQPNRESYHPIMLCYRYTHTFRLYNRATHLVLAEVSSGSVHGKDCRDRHQGRPGFTHTAKVVSWLRPHVQGSPIVLMENRAF